MAEVLAEELCEILELAPMPMRLVALTHALMLQISDTDEPMAQLSRVRQVLHAIVNKRVANPVEPLDS